MCVCVCVCVRVCVCGFGIIITNLFFLIVLPSLINSILAPYYFNYHLFFLPPLYPLHRPLHPQCRTFERDRVGGVYEGHAAQVTRVEWRYAGEDSNSIFLSAALDDSIRVWYIDKAVPIAILRLVEVRLT